MEKVFESEQFGAVRSRVDESGVAYINAADAAIGLGFVQNQRKGGKTYTSIRWETVNRYLRGFGFPQIVGENDFIPENMFYRLAMKAQNAAAEKFQAFIADVVVPGLRAGKILIPTANAITPAFLRALADKLEHAELVIGRVNLLEGRVAQLQGQIDGLASYRDALINSKKAVPVGILAKEYGFSSFAFNKILNRLGVQFKIDGAWVLYRQYAALGWAVPEPVPFTRKDGSTDYNYQLHWTQKGRLGLRELLRAHGYLPLVEQEARHV